MWAEEKETNAEAISRLFGPNGPPPGVRASVVSWLSEEEWIGIYGSGQPVEMTEEELSRVTVYAAPQ